MYGKKKMEGACYLLDAAEGRSNRAAAAAEMRQEAREPQGAPLTMTA